MGPSNSFAETSAFVILSADSIANGVTFKFDAESIEDVVGVVKCTDGGGSLVSNVKLSIGGKEWTGVVVFNHAQS